VTGLLQRLRDRKLAKWLVGYCAGAWVLLQVLGLLAGTYGWPPSAMRIAVAVAVVGFFIALVLAWYHGERGVQRATRVEAVLLLLVVAVGGAAIWHSEHGRTAADAAALSKQPVQQPVKPATRPNALKSIAVLPFVNMSTDPENEFFSDGLSEEILNSLARIDGMQVVGRTSSFQFKGKNEDLRTVGEKLGVDTVLEGSVRREGERARITAQLIRTADGIHLWSETYDRTLKDTLSVQLDIAEKVAGALDVLLDDKQRQRMRKAGISNVDAFIAYQKGLKLYDDAHGKASVGLLEGLRQANAEFDKATALEPDFYEALYAKADLYEHTLQTDKLGQAERLEAQRKALETLQLAAAASKDTQQRLLTLAERQMLSDDWHGLPALIDAAFKAPGCNYSNWLPVFASAFGYGDAFEDQGARASACDPLNRINYNTRVSVALATGHPQRALDIGARLQEVFQRPTTPSASRAIALAMLGRVDAAGKELDAVDATTRPDSYAVARIVVGHAQGRSPADIRAQLKAIERTQGKFSQWLVADAIEAAHAGNRAEANRLAAAMDARPAGPFLLAVLSQGCYCGAPFDLEATPNFKARLSESGLRWPPPATIAYPPPKAATRP
jgi:TolB-like protein/phage shock protein PspC (stress-responsive transcriptional regulator)